jgi:hypothetical protein
MTRSAGVCPLFTIRDKMNARRLTGKFDRTRRPSLAFLRRKYCNGRSRQGQSNYERADEHIQNSRLVDRFRHARGIMKCQ